MENLMLKNREGVSALEVVGSYSQSSWKRVPWTCSVRHHVEYLPIGIFIDKVASVGNVDDILWHLLEGPKPSYLPLLWPARWKMLSPFWQCSSVDNVLYNYTVLHLLVFEDALEKSGAWESWEIERLGLGPTSVWTSFIFLLFISILDWCGYFHARFFYSSKNMLCRLPSWLNQIVQISYE